MKPPLSRLRHLPPEGGRRPWPGKAGSTASAGTACSAAIGRVGLLQRCGPWAVGPGMADG